MSQPIWNRLLILVACLGALCSAALGAGNPRFSETLSPDGGWVAFVDASEGDPEVILERTDGTGRRQLTDNANNEASPTWSPDGARVAFASDRDGSWQVYAVTLADGSVEQLSHDAGGASHPEFGPDGRIVWRARRGTAFKNVPLYDLIVSGGQESVTLCGKSPLWDVAWSPDGKAIAWSSTDEIVFHRFEDGTGARVPLSKLDKRLRSHFAEGLEWRPGEEGVHCRLRFLGGVPEGSQVFGDGDACVIWSDGRIGWLDDPAE